MDNDKNLPAQGSEIKQVFIWVARVISAIAGMLAIANIGHNFLVEIKATTGLIITAIPTPFLFISFIILESFLAYLLGWCIVYLSHKGKGLGATWLFVTTLISAWTSLFNVQWILIGPTPKELKPEYGIKLMAFTMIAFFIAIQFIYHHGYEKETERAGTLSSVQAGAFFIMYFTFLFWL